MEYCLEENGHETILLGEISEINATTLKSKSGKKICIKNFNCIFFNRKLDIEIVQKGFR